jgi:ABC-type molybdate transport system substrate-binding protein
MPTETPVASAVLRRRALLAAGGLAATGLAAALMPRPARAEDPMAAPDVVMFCEPTLHGMLRAAGEQYRARTGVPVRLFPSPTRLILQQIARGLRCDLLAIETGDDVGMQAAAPHLREQVQPGWSNRLVIATRAPISVAVPLPQVLDRQGKIALVDAGVDPSGRRTRQALAATGMLDAVMRRSIGTVGTADALFLLAGGDASAAILYATDLYVGDRADDASLAVAAQLPPSSYESPRYALAVTGNVVSVNAVPFMGFLQGAEANPVLRMAGLEIAA